MELKLTEESPGANKKLHSSWAEGCWGREPLIPLYFWPTAQDKVGSNGKKKLPGREMHVLMEVRLVYDEVVRLRMRVGL